LIIEQGKDLVVFIALGLEHTLGESLSATELVGDRRLDGLGGAMVEMGIVGPDILDLSIDADGDTAGIDEEIELGVAEEGDPVEPLDVGCCARSPDGTRRKTLGREGEAATSGALDGLTGVPGGGAVGDEVGLEDHLELDEGVGGIGGDEGRGEEGGSMGDGEDERL